MYQHISEAVKSNATSICLQGTFLNRTEHISIYAKATSKTIYGNAATIVSSTFILTSRMTSLLTFTNITIENTMIFFKNIQVYFVNSTLKDVCFRDMG